MIIQSTKMCMIVSFVMISQKFLADCIDIKKMMLEIL